ncbi:MAG TPA: hypothetical protein VGL09_17450 [Methylomirabilota bacterium]
MSRPAVSHRGAEQATSSTSAAIARALVFDVDVDRHKRIDRYIDYFGGGRTVFALRRRVGEGPISLSDCEEASA